MKIPSLILHIPWGQRCWTVTLPPLALLLIVLSGLSGYGFSWLGSWQQQQDQARAIDRLQGSNLELEYRLRRQKTELQRVANLAEQQASLLWDQLEKRQGELQALRQTLEQQRYSLMTQGATVASNGSPNSPPAGRHRSLAARGGNLVTRFAQLQRQLAAQKQAVKQMAQETRDLHQAEVNLRQQTCPSGPPCQGPLTSPFGQRTHPIFGVGRFHNGCDFTTPEGSKIFATGAGRVIKAGWLGGYGQTVEIDHGRDLHTLYAHCSQILAQPGQRVQRGDWIANVGMTGLASGPHCHYEVRYREQALDPQQFLASPFQNFFRPGNYTADWGKLIMSNSLHFGNIAQVPSAVVW